MRAVESIAGPPSGSMLTNGANGSADEAPLIEEYLGTIIGSRIVAKGNHTLNVALLTAKEKASREQ